MATKKKSKGTGKRWRVEVQRTQYAQFDVVAEDEASALSAAKQLVIDGQQPEWEGSAKARDWEWCEPEPVDEEEDA